jgi:hypothetical protein
VAPSGFEVRRRMSRVAVRVFPAGRAGDTRAASTTDEPRAAFLRRCTETSAGPLPLILDAPSHSPKLSDWARARPMTSFHCPGFIDVCLGGSLKPFHLPKSHHNDGCFGLVHCPLATSQCRSTETLTRPLTLLLYRWNWVYGCLGVSC